MRVASGGGPNRHPASVRIRRGPGIRRRRPSRPPQRFIRLPERRRGCSVSALACSRIHVQKRRCPRPSLAAGSSGRQLHIANRRGDQLAEHSVIASLRSGWLSLALATFQHIGFVGLDNAGELSRLPAARNQCRQREAVLTASPQRTSDACTASTQDFATHRCPVRETGSERQPSRIAVKARQRRACRCIERLPAALALIPAQASRLATRNSAGSAAMRAPAVFADARLDCGQRASREHSLDFPALRCAELVNLGEPSLKLLVIHHLRLPLRKENIT